MQGSNNTVNGGPGDVIDEGSLIGTTNEAASDAAALASATTQNGVTTVNLSDGTALRFLGGQTLLSWNFF